VNGKKRREEGTEEGGRERGSEGREVEEGGLERRGVKSLNLFREI
jgi:hypothetical protein